MSRSSASWKLLEDMMIELKKSGVTIPVKVVEDLRTAKSLLELSCTAGNHGGSLQKAEEYLANVEAYLFTEGEKALGAEKVDAWLRQLEETNVVYRQKTGLAKAEDKFVTGVPRNQKWVRVEPLEEWTAEKIGQIANEQNLLVKPQADGKLVVYGQPENLKAFVKKMAAERAKPLS